MSSRTTAYPLSSWTSICFDVTVVADNFCMWLFYFMPTSFESLRPQGRSSQKALGYAAPPPGDLARLSACLNARS
jgi:hypothetical protein